MRGDTGTYYLRSTATSARSCSTSATPTISPSRTRCRPRADVLIQNFRPGGLAGSASTTTPCAAATGRDLLLDQRLRRRQGRAPARLRPAGAGRVRPDEPDRLARRAAVPRRHLGLRRDDRPALGHRHPGRAAPSRPDRRGPARRDEPAVDRAVDPGQPDLGLRRRRRRAAAHGQRAPVAVPVRAAADRRRRADRDRRQRPAVPQLAAALGIPEIADDERFATVGARNDNREELRPLLLERLATGRRRSGSTS